MSKTMDKIQRACRKQWESRDSMPLVVTFTNDDFMELHREMMMVSPYAVRPLPFERIASVVNPITGDLMPVGRLMDGDGYAVTVPGWSY